MPAPGVDSLTPARSSKPVAVVDIGTTSVRMAIAEINTSGGVRKLESLSQAVRLGKDTFTAGFIRKSTIEECVRVLRRYRQVLAEYGISSPEQIRVVATSAVREARNRLAFIDRIYIATGFRVEPIDEAEVNRVTYLGVQPLLQASPSLSTVRTLIVEVGGGSTELLVVRGGDVVYANALRLGSLRLRETLEAYRTPTLKVREMMENQIERAIKQVTENVPQTGKVEILAMGGDVRFAASRLVTDWNPNQLSRISLVQLERLTDKLLSMSDDAIVRNYHLSFAEAETAGPALLTYMQLARTYGLDTVLVANINLRDGLLNEMAAKAIWTEQFSNQIIRSALDLGRRYHFDEPHARHVADLSRRLFQAIRDEHQLDHRHEIILYVAALLHEIGYYVSQQSHHKHSLYLIKNSEMFGLSRRDVLLAALVARYYRRASPQPSHEGYATLSRDERVAVAKMAAMLRVAVALDDSRSQRIADFTCNREPGRFVITVPTVKDLSLEQLAIRQNGSLFEETFGVPVLLRTRRDETL
jgi:exopolyphosphatase/guanosine-5'-triphosphate,3'-diphosphate pyrophosphatase